MKEFDIVAIGSGSGLMVIEAALSKGLNCAVIEKSKIGGTCLNKGCIPSKMLVYPADLIKEAKEAKKIGLNFSEPVVDWEEVSKRMWGQIDLNIKIEKNLKEVPNLTLYKGLGKFTSPNTMIIEDEDGNVIQEIKAKKFIIASGARSFVPPIKGLEETGYVIPETFFGNKFPKKPWNRLVIIGGGAIGAEFANIFSSFNTKVTILEMKPHIIATEEEEISKFVEKQFKKYDIDVFTNTGIVKIEKSGNNKLITIEDLTTKKQKVIECDEILMASGVRSNGDLLDLEKANVKVDAKGYIITDQYLQTSQKDIYAIGDINGKYQFRHKANYEAEVLIKNLFSNNKELKEVRYENVPWTIFTHPQVAHAGLTQKELKDKGIKHYVGYNYYSDVVAGRAMGYSRHDDDNGFAKIIVGEDKKILGIHVVGPQASLLVQPFVYLMNAGHECNSLIANEKGISNCKDLDCLRVICPNLGTYEPINDSMIMHPSLNELTAWALEEVDWSKKE